MARIPYVEREQASEEVQVIYDKIKRATRGWVPNFYRAIAHRPKVLQAIWALQEGFVFEGKLSRRQRELLNVHVSRLNNCHY